MRWIRWPDVLFGIAVGLVVWLVWCYWSGWVGYRLQTRLELGVSVSGTVRVVPEGREVLRACRVRTRESGFGEPTAARVGEYDPEIKGGRYHIVFDGGEVLADTLLGRWNAHTRRGYDKVSVVLRTPVGWRASPTEHVIGGPASDASFELRREDE